MVKKWGLAHKHDNSGSGVIILDENLVEISFIIAEILLFVKFDHDQHFKGQLLLLPASVKNGRIIAEI